MNRLLVIPLAATICVAVPAGAAFAVTAYDARTLGMGGSSVGYSGNASLAYWNPAAAAMSKNWGIYLPSVGLSISNNILAVGDILNLASLGASLSKPSAGNTMGPDLLKTLGGAQGLNVFGEALVEPFGVATGRLGPGNIAIRAYGHGVLGAKLSLSSDFAENLGGLFFESNAGGKNGFNQILEGIQAVSGEASAAAADPLSGDTEALKGKIQALKTSLDKNMSSFIKRNGAKTSVKTLALDTVTSVNAAVAATYAQPLPIKIAALPDSEITVGITAKVFSAPTAQLAAVAPAMQLPGGSTNASLSPIGGGAGANLSLDIDKEVTDLVDAIDKFLGAQNLATSAEVLAKSGLFFSNGLAKSKVGFSSTTPDSVGAGFDIGAAMKINKQWSVGLSVINPLLFWGATKNNYTYDFSGAEIRRKDGPSERVSFSQAEPTIIRLGGAFQPDLLGPPILVKDILLNLGLEAPLNNGQSPSVHLGVEKLLGPLALRLGTAQGGISPLYTAGLGIQTRWFQLNLGLGVDNPSPKLKSGAVSLTLGALF